MIKYLLALLLFIGTNADARLLSYHDEIMLRFEEKVTEYEQFQNSLIIPSVFLYDYPIKYRMWIQMMEVLPYDDCRMEIDAVIEIIIQIIDYRIHGYDNYADKIERDLPVTLQCHP